MGYRVVNGKVYPIGNFPQSNDLNQKSSKDTFSKFEEILKSEINKKDNFTISNHAAKRLEDRNIKLTEADISHINEGINMADEKGSKDSLILYKDVALVTSIKNRTIITAVNKSEAKGNVFTNIDSVVIL
ncbi:flagellar biosynthesis protein [Clostridium bovifaecis]|uniref:Flagellar biosynthesis protein n=1 Tax=Clostridium bovifaecis TaxID=2184719 RepID=A0A6I6F3X7_9CLOT|nr:flagellar biosynthesis protein [Clostridium bovifaecis]